MIFDSINIIIPSITISRELVFCLKKINNLSYKNFQVTIVLDHKNKKKIPKFNYKVNEIIVGKKNMSAKRNLAAKSIKTKYIAFIDSDAYPPENWLKNAVKIIKNKKIHIVGGPDIPFKNQTKSEMISHFSKRSFFITGHLNYRKTLGPEKVCEDWLASCNLIMSRKFYLKNKGMNERKYFQEDQEFFDRIRKNNKKIKVIFSPEVFVFHKERSISKFFLQRLSFGTALIEAINPSSGFKGFIPALPILFFILMIIFISFMQTSNDKVNFLIAVFCSINFAIFLEIRKYIKSYIDRLLVILSINIASILHIIGSILSIFKLKKFLERRIYLLSRNNY